MSDNRKEQARQRFREALAKRPIVAVPRINEVQQNSVTDDAASKEASAIASGDLEADAAKNEHRRTERFRDAIANAVLVVFWIGFVVLILAVFVWIANFLTPNASKFLTAEQSQGIFSFVTGSGVTGFLSNYFKKRA